MTKLSDSQLVVLTTACQRADGCVFPVTIKLKGNAVGNVLKSLLTKGLVEEVRGRADDTVWRYDDGAPLTLKATRAAYDALGIEPDGEPVKAKRRAAAADDTPLDDEAASPEAGTRTPRKDTKQAQLIAMLQRPEGATVAEIAAALGWQHHTVRGAIAGALKKRLGLNVISDKTWDDERGRVYRVAAGS